MKYAKVTREVFDKEELDAVLEKARVCYEAAFTIIGTAYKDGAWHVPEPVGITPKEDCLNWLKEQIIEGEKVDLYDFLTHCGFQVARQQLVPHEFSVVKTLETTFEELPE